MIRSAKMKRDDPAEADAAVPQHRRQGHVADRADEAEHRNHRADERAPHLGRQRVAGEEQVLPERGGHPRGHRARDEQADQDVADDGRPLHDEDVAHRGEAAAAEQAAPEAPAGRDAHVHGGVALHGTRQALVRLLARGVDQPLADEDAEDHRQQDDHDRPADEFGQGELPADQQREDDAQFDDEIGAGDLERHRGDETRAPSEQGPGEGHRRIGAGRGRGAKPGRLGQGARPAIAEHRGDRFPPDHGLDDRRQREAQDQRPGDLPRHGARERQRMADGGENGHSHRPSQVRLRKYPGPEPCGSAHP